MNPSFFNDIRYHDDFFFQDFTFELQNFLNSSFHNSDVFNTTNFNLFQSFFTNTHLTFLRNVNHILHSSNIKYRTVEKEANQTIIKSYFLIVLYHLYNRNHDDLINYEDYLLKFLLKLYDNDIINFNDVERIVMWCFDTSIYYSDSNSNQIKEIALFQYGLHLFINLIVKKDNQDINRFGEKIMIYLTDIIFNNKRNCVIMSKRTVLFELIRTEVLSSSETGLRMILFNLLSMIYSFNYSEVIFNGLMENIKNALIQIKDKDLETIRLDINILRNEIDWICYLIDNENKKMNNDKRMIMSGYVFDDSGYSGMIITNVNYVIKNNSIFFSFYQCKQTKEQPATLLYLLNTEKGYDFHCYLLNNTLYIQIYKEIYKIKREIILNKTYHVALYISQGFSTIIMKVKVNHYNEDIKIKRFNFETHICSIGNSIDLKEKKLKASYFVGIIGPVLLYNSLFNNTDIELFSSIPHEHNKLIYDPHITICNPNQSNSLTIEDSKSLWKNNGNLILCVQAFNLLQSFTNSNEYYDYYDYLNNHKNSFKNDKIQYTFEVTPIPENHATYPFSYNSSVTQFLKYNGIDYLTLNLEYYYTLLRTVKDIDIVNNIMISVESLLTLNYILVEHAYKTNDDKTLGMQMRLFFSLTKVLNLVNGLFKPTNNFIDILLKYTQINSKTPKLISKDLDTIEPIMKELAINIFFLLLDHKLYDSSNALSYKLSNLPSKHDMQLITLLIPKVFGLKSLLIDNKSDICKEYERLISIIVSLSNLKQIIDMISILNSYHHDPIIVEKLITLIYLNHPLDYTDHSEQEKTQIVDKCLDLSQSYPNCDMIQAILIQFFFNLGSLSTLNDSENKDDNNYTLERSKPIDTIQSDKNTNDKSILNTFQYSFLFIKSCLLYFFEFSPNNAYKEFKKSNKEFIEDISKQSLKHDYIKLKLYLKLVINYISSIPLEQKELFQFMSLIIIQQFTRFTSYAKEIFMSNNMCSIIFSLCFKRYGKEDNYDTSFMTEVNNNLRIITANQILYKHRPFIYSLYYNLLSINIKYREYLLNNFQFDIVDIGKSNDDIQCYNDNIKEYAILLWKVSKTNILLDNFPQLILSLKRIFQSNECIFLPDLIECNKEGKKMTLFELLLEALCNRLKEDDFSSINNYIYERKDSLNSMMYLFDLKNQKTKRIFAKKVNKINEETDYLTLIIYNKYKDNPQWKEITNKILQEINDSQKKKLYNFDMTKRIIPRKNSEKYQDHFSIEDMISDTSSMNQIINDETINSISCQLNKDTITNSKSYSKGSLSKSKDNDNDSKKFQSITDTSNITRDFYDLSLPNAVICLKRDLLLTTFSLYFLDIYFDDDQFYKLKASYSANILNNVSKDRTIYPQGVELHYPTSIKNYSSSDSYQPRIFLKKDLKFYTHEYFSISHDYYQPQYSHKKIISYHTLITDKYSNPLQSDYLKQRTIIFQSKGQLLKNDNTTNGELYLTHKYLLFYSRKDNLSYLDDRKLLEYCFRSSDYDIKQKDKEVFIILNKIKEIIIRRYLYMYQAIEIFMKNGKCYFINMFQSDYVLGTKESMSQGILDHLGDLKIQFDYTYNIISEAKKEVSRLNLVDKWATNQLSTYDFILLLNKYSGRTYNDLNQYPIIPWVYIFLTKEQAQSLLNEKNKKSFINSKSNQEQTVKIKDQSNHSIKKNHHQKVPKKPFLISSPYATRVFDYPIPVNSESYIEEIKQKYADQKRENNKFPIHFQLFYSTLGYVIYYLFRLNPFTRAQIAFQSGKFDASARQFNSYYGLNEILYHNNDTRELIPEIISSFEYCLNLNYNNFGVRNFDKLIINHFELPPGIIHPAQLSFIQQSQLNSNNCKEEIHSWINNIFGYNQFRPNDTSIINIYNKYCYGQIIRLNKKKEKYLKTMTIPKVIQTLRCKSDYILSFGQAPEQVINEMIKKWNKLLDEECLFDDNESFDNLMQTSNCLCKDKYIDRIVLLISFTSERKYLYVLLSDLKKRHHMQLKIFRNIKEFSEPCSLSVKKMKLFKMKSTEKNNLNFIFRYHVKYSIIDLCDGDYFIIGRYKDNSLRIYRKDNLESYTYMTDSFVSSLYYCNRNTFLSGHRNGRLIHWNIIYDKAKDKTSIRLVVQRELLAHTGLISSITYVKKHNIIITTADDHLLLIRKYNTFELLTKISTNSNSEYFTDCVFSSYNFIYTMTMNVSLIKSNWKSKYSHITGYSLNGISFSKSNSERFNELCVNNKGLVIAGICDPPSIVIYSLEWNKGYLLESGDIQMQSETILFQNNFPWGNYDSIESLCFFNNFVYLDDNNTFYVNLTKKMGRFSCSEDREESYPFFLIKK